MPRRIQLKRTAGWRMPTNTVKVDRSTIFGNPFDAGRLGAPEAVALHLLWLLGTLPDEDLRKQLGSDEVRKLRHKRRAVLKALPTIRGKDLACWCAPDLPCHATTLLELANK